MRERNVLVALAAVLVGGCATLTEDAMTPIAMSFSDGPEGLCQLTNKRGAWTAEIPGTVSVRKSDDSLKYQCKTSDEREATGALASEMGAKIVASAVFLDLGITDAITDKHRKYAGNVVVPVKPRVNASLAPESDGGDGPESVYSQLEHLGNLRDRGVITDAEFEVEKRKLLNE